MSETILRHTPFEFGTKIELLVDAESVSRLLVFDLQMRIGNIPVRCGGIGDVETKREHRNKGYARQVLEESVAMMRAQGYHLAALYGISDFYHRFGFMPALVEEAWTTIATRDAEAARARYVVREMMPTDVPAVAAIYEAGHCNRTGSIVRNPATWKGFRLGSHWHERIGAFVVVEGTNVLGYASYDLEAPFLSVAEVGASTPEAYSTILAHAAQRAVALRAESIIFYAPPDDPFVAYCHRYGCESKLFYPRAGNGMARIINQTALLSLVQPLLAQRLCAQGLGGWGGKLLFRTDLGEDRLCFGPGKELGVALPQWQLGQLLLGYCSVSDALTETEMRVDEGAVPILEALFPPGCPYIWSTDRF